MSLLDEASHATKTGTLSQRARTISAGIGVERKKLSFTTGVNGI